jgi:hypothetical protein
MGDDPRLRAATPDAAGGGKRQVSLMLAYMRITNTYEVKSITNSTWYKPGDWISADNVQKIVDTLPNWEVVMAELDFLSKIPIPVIGGIA